MKMVNILLFIIHGVHMTHCLLSFMEIRL